MRLPLGVAAALLLPCVQGGTDDHRYKKGEHVELWVNKVGRSDAILRGHCRVHRCTMQKMEMI